MQSRRVRTGGLTQQILTAGPEDGSAPLVLLLHGFPELGVSWRAQVQALAEAGYRAVAPDMRGYGGTDKPADAADYSMLHLVGDMVDLVRALGQTQAVVVGHDWGGPVAWHCALMRPDIFRAVASLSTPFQPRRAGGPPLAAMAAISRRAGLGDLYINRFQAPDAHAPMDADPAAALRKMFWAYDGATPADRRSTGVLKPGVDLLDSIGDDAVLPPWMSPEHFDEYVEAFTAGGFKGPVDWYRALDLNWALTAWLQDKRIDVPGLFIVGEDDPVRLYAGRNEATLKDWVPALRGAHVLAGAGHWLQQERPEAVNRLLVEFLRDL